MPPLLSPAPRRALVIKLGHIGDVLVATPVITALKEAWPDLAIDMVVNQGTEAMIEHNPLLNRVLVLKREHASRRAGLAWQAGFLRRLRGAGYDLSLELAEGDRGAFLSWISGARTRVGFRPSKPRLRERAYHLLADRPDDAGHMVESFLRQTTLLGIAPQDTGLKFEPGSAARQRAGEILAGAEIKPGSYALVHPTSRWMFKSWTPAGNAALISHLAKQGLKVVLTSGPNPKEMALVERIRDLTPPGAIALDLAGNLDLYVLGGLIASARVFAGVDSAPMHMAAALGAPVLTIFGPSGEHMWGPWQAPAEVLVGDCPDHPCGRSGCDGSKKSRCLEELPSERVCAALDRLLARTA